MSFGFETDRKHTDIAFDAGVEVAGSHVLDGVDFERDLTNDTSMGIILKSDVKPQSIVNDDIDDEISDNTDGLLLQPSDSVVNIAVSESDPVNLEGADLPMFEAETPGKLHPPSHSHISSVLQDVSSSATGDETDDPGEGVSAGLLKSAGRQGQSAYLRGVRNALARGLSKEQAAQAGARAASSAVNGQLAVTSSSAVATSSTAGAAGGSAVGVGGGSILAAIGAVFGLVLLGAITLIMIVGLFCVAQPRSNYYELTDVENRMVDRLRHHGFDDVHIAAILGNGFGESGNQPDSDAGVSGGLFHWDSGNFSNMKAAAAAAGKDWRTDVEWQIDYWVATYRGMWIGARAHNYWAYWTEYAGVTASLADWDAATDPKKACFMMMAGFEGCAYGSAAHLDRRAEHAQMVYDAISSKGQQYEASEGWQKSIVDACHRTSWPGRGYCLRWVNDVFDNAGHSFPRMPRARDAYNAYCHTSDKSKLQVGMIVAVPSSPTSPTIGHIAIYVGDGQVMDSIESGIRTTSLDAWISYYGSATKWGYPW